MKKGLILILLVLVSIDLILILLVSKVKLETINFNNIFRKKTKDFVIKDNGFILTNSYKIIKYGKKQRIWLKGYISNDLYFDKLIKNYILPVRLTNEYKSVNIRFILGPDDRPVLTLRSDNGVIDLNQIWKLKLIKEVLFDLKKNDPIFINVVYESSMSNFKNELENCGALCEVEFKQIEKYYQNNSKIVNFLDNKNVDINNLVAGPIDSLVIYVK